MEMKDWPREFERLLEENSRLVREIRHLRCVMVEAAGSIDRSQEPTLFKHLMGCRDHFVDESHNPYPEHDDHVSDQYMSSLTIKTEALGGYDVEEVLGDFFRSVSEG